MSKVICDICGTTYQDTAPCCPICGCPREMAREEDAPSQRSAPRKKEIFDFDEVNHLTPRDSEPEDLYAYDEEDDPAPDGQTHNTALVILLTVLIVVLLALTGFLFVKYFLPNMARETEPAPTVAATIATAAPQETTQPRIPCQSLALSSGNAELSHEGMQFLLNVLVTPADTTDTLTYLSEDETVATVDAAGRITAVAEGETVVTVVCGDKKISCPVICRFVDDSGETTAATVQETAAPTVDSSITLKLKKTDIMLNVFYYFTLELDCDLEPTDVEWSSAHPYIAAVDEKGVVTAMKAGTTTITAKYGDQEAKCIVRCS